MAEENHHTDGVDAWMARAGRQLPPDRLLRAFDDAFAAMWRRAHPTLGDVTLTAVVDRVLYVAAERYPSLSSLKVEATGLRCEELHQRAQDLNGDHLAEGLRFVLVEFLTILGNLTDEILTPALHEELSKPPPGKRANPDSKDGEGAKS